MGGLRHHAVALAIAACLAAPAMAADELVLYAFVDGAPARTLSVVIDGGAPVPLGADGAVTLDLAPGTHTVQLSDGQRTLHSFRVVAAAGQKVDVVATLRSGSAPQVTVDAWSDTESVTSRAQARTGVVSGVITGAAGPLAGARLTVRGAAATATADAVGRYTLSLPRGLYTLVVEHPSLGGEPLQQGVRVVGGVEVAQTVAAGNTPQTTSIVIEARRLPVQRGLDEQFASGVVDTLDAEDIGRYGGSSVAASVVNVPSITLQDSRYIFIRGLGDRYVTTTLNGATLPSTDPSRRTVPLDLFPSSFVSQLALRKSFTANMPGESTGGNLLISTATLPAQAGGQLSVALGGNTRVTGSSIYTDPIRGDFDVFGVDDGARRENGLLPLIGEALTYSDEFSQSARAGLQQVGGLLISEDLDLRRTTATPLVGLGLNYGDLIDLGEGRRLGYYAAGNFGHNTTQRDRGITRTYGSNGQVLDDFTFIEQSRVVDNSGLLALGFRQGDHSLASTTLLSRSTESTVRVAEGFDGDELLPSYRYDIDWIERQFVSQQVSGEHRFNGLLARWQVTGSQAWRYAPDRRELRFDLEGGDGVYNLQVPALLRRFDDLRDDNLDLSTDWEAPVGAGTLSFGAQLIRRDREAESNSYGFTGGQSLDDNAPNRRVDDVITPVTITGDTATGYAFQDKTLPSDSYDAELRQSGAYLSYDVLLGDFQLIAGGRYERYRQTTDTFGLEGGQAAVRSEIDKTSFLPSLTVNWLIDDEQQLRLALSRTVARPDFKETSNATFYDTEFDFRVRGNPLLKPAAVSNLDLRYERYWSERESASVAFFYKSMTDPIERVVQAASGTAGNSRTFRNAPKARLYGIEVEGRRDFALSADLNRSLFVALNASLIKSSVDLPGGGSRDLQGQPGYTTNLIFGLDDVVSGQEVTLLLNQSGRSIQDVGVNDLPDVLAEPRLSVNLNYRYRYSTDLQFKVKVTNLLDSDVRFTQGGQVFQQYRRGTEIEAGLELAF